MFGGINCNIVG